MALTDGPFAMIAPLLLWGGYLLFVYVVLAVGCAVGPEAGGATLPALWLATVAAIVSLTLLGSVQFRHLKRAEHPEAVAEAGGVRTLALKAGLLVGLISLVAVLWTALPLLFIAPCAR